MKRNRRIGGTCPGGGCWPSTSSRSLALAPCSGAELANDAEATLVALGRSIAQYFGLLDTAHSVAGVPLSGETRDATSFQSPRSSRAPSVHDADSIQISPTIDPLVVDKTYDRYRRGKRTLEVVAAHYAVMLEGAHDAAADAIAAGRVAQAIAARFDLDISADELHTQQISWARAQAESLSEYFVRIGRIDADVDGSWPIR